MSGFYEKCVFFALLGFTLSFLSLRAEQVAAPTFSQPTGTYHTPVTITLDCATPDARIFYTLDGSEPTTAATLYTGKPILIYRHVSGDTLQGISDNDPDPADEYAILTNISAHLRAIAVKDGWEDSPVREAIYVIDRVDATLNIPYADPPPAGGTKHQLDVYQPHGRQNTPVLFFVHGGAWMQGDKNMYMELGNTFAGIYHFTTVVVNYQLSSDPWNAVHPTHIQDVALAFDWVVTHIAKYGGDPANIFVFGQSAGGHLLSLLATDERYLQPHELGTDQIRKVVSMSGAYALADLVQWPLNPLNLTAEEVLMYKTICLNTFEGWEAADLNAASPETFIHANQPPFLVVSLNESETFHDMPGFRQEAINFTEKIQAMNGPFVELTYISEDDLPSAILELDFPGDFDAHYQEIYAINTEYADCKSARIVAKFFQTPLARPLLKAPLADASNVSTHPEFSWEPDLAASYYHLQVAEDYNFQNSVFAAEMADASWCVTGLKTEQTYYWRVKAVSEIDTSEWSEIRAFTTGNSAGVAARPASVSRPELIQSYPNPFNGSVRLEFQFAHGTETGRLEIFNVRGRLVFSQEMTPGKGRTSFNWKPAADLESGVYFVRLKTGSTALVQRITYLK